MEVQWYIIICIYLCTSDKSTRFEYIGMYVVTFSIVTCISSPSQVLYYVTRQLLISQSVMIKYIYIRRQLDALN